MQEFINGNLLIETIDPMDEKKTTIRLNDLVENADQAAVKAVADAIQTALVDPVSSVKAVYTYEFEF